jgi:hypothetical protein
MGRHYDDAAFSSEQLLRKLAAGRVDLALLFREEWEAALPGLPAQELETLARPFIETDLYLAAGRHLDPAQRRLVQAWWDAIGQLREPPVLRN